MRISLLLQREPFGTIFEKTVASFLENQLNAPVAVQWINGRTNTGRIKCEKQQTWLCNTYLNAIFVETVKSHVFEPVYREFSRSTQWWKRPLQRLYVDGAVSPATRAYLAQATITISPPLPNAEYCLFIGGNHKIRLLDVANSTAFGILKAGFPSQPMAREITARKYAAELGLPVPSLQYVAPNGTWLREAFVTGTPLNRLPNELERKRAIAKMLESLHRLRETTSEEVDTVEFTSQLAMRAQHTADAIAVSSITERQNLQRMCKQLNQHIERLAVKQQRVLTALTHGDCQPANILVNDGEIWLIDWEYADRRIVGYDELVFGLQSRSPAGLARRLANWVTDASILGVQDSTWVRKKSSRPERELIAAIFLLEELVLHVMENANPQFIQLGHGLQMLQNEVNIWLQFAGA